MRFRPFLILFLVSGCQLLVSRTQACGHEGWYAGFGYTQLVQFSPDRQLTAGGAASPRVDWRTRWGAHGRIGHDFCGSRWGMEVPVSLDRQRLNRNEIITQFGLDANAVFHIIETEGGTDFYWIAGTGMNIAREGPINNNSGAAGINLNFGPGFQYFIKRKKPNVAIGFSVPVKYTLYFGNNLSGNKKTSVIGFPLRFGFSVGF